MRKVPYETDDQTLFKTNDKCRTMQNWAPRSPSLLGVKSVPFPRRVVIARLEVRRGFLDFGMVEKIRYGELSD